MSPDFVVATWRHTPISTRLVADDRTAWRELGRFHGTPSAATWIPPNFSVQYDDDVDEDAGGLPDVIDSGASAPVVSAKAAEVFKAWWGQQAELLPLRADVGEWFAINTLRLVSVIDADRSVVRRFENSENVMSIKNMVLDTTRLDPDDVIFKDMLAPSMYTFVTSTMMRAAAANDLVGFDPRVVWPPDHALKWRQSQPPSEPILGMHLIVPGSGTLFEGGYRLTDDSIDTWVHPDRARGLWYALRIPGGWADLPPLPGTEVTLESEGQSRTILTVSCTPGDGPPPLEVAVAVAALGDGELDPSPPRHFTAAGRPAVAAQAVAIDANGATVATVTIVIDCGSEHLVIGAVTTDLTGVELGMVMGLAAHDLLIEHLN